MYQLEETGRFEIEGRGTVITVKNPHLPELYDPHLLFLEDSIQIGDEVFHIRGIETFGGSRSKESPYVHDFGILV